MFEEYQLQELQELFNVEVIESTLGEDFIEMSAQERAVLKFIVDNPEKQFIDLQNTFSVTDFRVVSIVLEYGTPTEEYDEIKELREAVQSE